MRLTDVDKVYEIIVDQYHLKTEIQKLALRETLTKVPMVDAEPVRHGRWEWSEDNWWHRCTACGVTFDYDKTYELFDHGFQLANYCPNCGARMDGGKNV